MSLSLPLSRPDSRAPRRTAREPDGSVTGALAIAVYLIIYYSLIAFLVAYMGGTFQYSEQRANALGNWMWAFNAAALVAVGVLSDRLRVRKPFMVVGALGTVVATLLFARLTYHPDTGYYTFVWVLSLMALFMGVTITSWFASFTESVERRNPALTATGLAAMAWILRIVVAASFFALPFVVTSASPVVEHGTQVQAIQARYPTEVATLQALDARTATTLASNPSDTAAVASAVREVSSRLHVSPPVAVQRLLAVSKLASTRQGSVDLAFLQKYGPQVQAAVQASPGQWRTWWWVCATGELVFIPLIFLLTGRWSPRRARRDQEDHERWVEAELAKLSEPQRSAAD